MRRAAYPMKKFVDTMRDVLRDDFDMLVKPTTVRLVSIVSDVARLADLNAAEDSPLKSENPCAVGNECDYCLQH